MTKKELEKKVKDLEEASKVSDDLNKDHEELIARLRSNTSHLKQQRRQLRYEIDKLKSDAREADQWLDASIDFGKALIERAKKNKVVSHSITCTIETVGDLSHTEIKSEASQ